MKLTTLSATAMTVVFAAFSATTVFAGGSHSDNQSSSTDIGQPGQADHVDRTINVEMGEMFFLASDYNLKPGETVRFVITNTGEFLHEFSIATEEMHLAHAGEMMAMMDSGMIEVDRVNMAMMKSKGNSHDDANSLLIEPGKTGEVIWTFDGDAVVEMSCNLPGHRESGMRGILNLIGS